jgi:hypothetical protein
MPGLLNLWYEQLSYHKILPFVCNLSIEISLHRAILVEYVLGVLGRTQQNFTGSAELSCQKSVQGQCLCDNFRRNLCQITKFFAPN